jgi:hypothetical protein
VIRIDPIGGNIDIARLRVEKRVALPCRMR